MVTTKTYHFDETEQDFILSLITHDLVTVIWGYNEHIMKYGVDAIDALQMKGINSSGTPANNLSREQVYTLMDFCRDVCARLQHFGIGYESQELHNYFVDDDILQQLDAKTTPIYYAQLAKELREKYFTLYLFFHNVLELKRI